MNDKSLPHNSNRNSIPGTASDESLDQELSFDLERLARCYADDFDLENSDNQGRIMTDSMEEEGVSLEELSQAFAKVVGSSVLPPAKPTASIDEKPPSHDPGEQPSAIAGSIGLSNATESEISIGDSVSSYGADDDHFPVTPTAIVEAVLLVGRPDNGAITATEIAKLMRGVTEAEVDQLIADLNADYAMNHRAMRIASSGGGYQMQLAQELDGIRQSFLGPARPVRLSQAAIDCLALVSYQPGIHREKLQEQLGKSSGAILNQLVRRQLLEIRRERIEGERKLVPRYYPTQRLLNLAGLESLDDLPTAEEWVERI